MKIFIVLSSLAAVCLAKPSGLTAVPIAAPPLAYAAPVPYARLVPGAPIGLDGRVVDTPEVNYAKAEHAAAHINEKLNLANEAVKSADYVTYAAAPLVATTYSAVAAPSLTLTKNTAGGAPIGLDGRVVDTAEVAYAKAEHAAAHINEKIEQSQEALRNSDYVTYAVAPVVSAAVAPTVALAKYTAGGAPIGLDGRVIDTPEVAYAKAEHAAAHINHNIEQSQEYLRNSPLLVSAYAAPTYATGYVQHYY